jgi:D-alanyl-D-alanine-carboxypeptidase/D-alanyl-D-alanine-endopeptidase
MRTIDTKTIAGATLLAGLAIPFIGCNAVAAAIATPDDIRQSLANYVGAHSYGAVVIGVIDNGKTSVYTLVGTNAKPVHERSTFQIGSVTKTFTATALASMVNAGEVSLNDPISKYLPPGVKAPSFNGKQITLLNLAEQNSGLPRLPDNLPEANPMNPYADYSPALLANFLSNYKLTRAPGAQYEYSNLGVGLLGDLLAARAHTTYAELVEHRVLRPLGMTHTVVIGSPATRSLLVPGYAPDGTPEPAWDLGELAAAGSIESSLHDMLLYLHANMSPPKTALGKAMALAQEPRYPIGPNGILKIGLVWNTNSNSGITWHNGETGGYHSFIGWDPQGHGVVLLANVADADLDTLAVHILAPLLVPAPVARVLEPSPYAGVYPLTPAFSITVFKSGGKLFVQGTAQPAIEIALVSDQTYAVQGVDARVTFDVDAKGNVTGSTLRQNGVDQHATKTATKPPGG